MEMPNVVGWFDLYVEDLERAVKFYELVLNLKLTEIIDPTGATQMMGFPASRSAFGAAGALVKKSHAHPGLGGTMIYFSVEDCATCEPRVLAANGKVIRPKFSIGEFGWVTLCLDTEGNMFGLSSIK